MSTQPILEWTNFRVGQLSDNPNWTNTDCQRLDEIYHVAHIESALQIVREGKIKAGLIFDESKLNTERILVVWLSPNDWTNAGGFRYGNVRFEFDWKKLIRGNRYYWVESIAYGVPAARILVTKADYDDRLETYDPTTGDGPWWYDKSSKRHYWNGDKCLEIMVESDLPLSDCPKIDFVDHHRRYCSIAPHNCADCGRPKDEAAGIFLAEVVARGSDHSSLKSVDFDLYRAFRDIKYTIDEKGEGIKFKGNAPKRATIPIARSILNAYARCDFEEMSYLMGLMKSTDAVKRSCAKLIAQTFDGQTWGDQPFAEQNWRHILNPFEEVAIL